MSVRFVAKILRAADINATGFVVPPEAIAALGESRRPAVKVTLNGYTYRSTVATMGGKFMIGVSAEHRTAAGLAGNEELEVHLELDLEPRITPIPDDLKAALQEARVLEAFEKAAPSRRKEFVRQVEEAKAPETRTRRIAKVIAAFS